MVGHPGFRLGRLLVANRYLDGASHSFALHDRGLGIRSRRNSQPGQRGEFERPSRGARIHHSAVWHGRRVDQSFFEDGQVVSTAAPLAVAQYVVAAIGPKIAKVAYAGEAPGAINGLIQVNVIIPDDAPVGPEVPVSLILSPYRSQSGVTVAIR